MLDWLIQNRNKATTVRNRYPDEYQKIMRQGAKSFQENLYRHIHGVSGKEWEVFSWETGYTNPYECFSWWEKALIFTNDDDRLMKIVGHWKVMSYSKDNKDIYSLPESENGRSFVTCPVLGFRMRMITSRYMGNILGMTVEEFDARYPGTIKICQSRRDNISAGLNAVDESGLTKHAKSTVTRKKTMTAVGEDGLTKYQKLGKKTRATHMAKKDENGMNGYQRIAKVARPKQNATMAAQGKRADLSNKHEWKAYRFFVDWLTKLHKEELMDGLKSGKAGTEGAYHVDHVYPAIRAFREGISPFVIAHRGNLEVLPWKENANKSASVTISIDELFRRTDYTLEQSKEDFEIVMSIIRQQTERSSIEIWEKYCEAIARKKPPV